MWFSCLSIRILQKKLKRKVSEKQKNKYNTIIKAICKIVGKRFFEQIDESYWFEYYNMELYCSYERCQEKTSRALCRDLNDLELLLELLTNKKLGRYKRLIYCEKHTRTYLLDQIQARALIHCAVSEVMKKPFDDLLKDK